MNWPWASACMLPRQKCPPQPCGNTGPWFSTLLEPRHMKFKFCFQQNCTFTLELNPLNENRIVYSKLNLYPLGLSLLHEYFTWNRIWALIQRSSGRAGRARYSLKVLDVFEKKRKNYLVIRNSSVGFKSVTEDVESWIDGDVSGHAEKAILNFANFFKSLIWTKMIKNLACLKTFRGSIIAK